MSVLDNIYSRANKIQGILEEMEEVLIEEPFSIDTDLNTVGKIIISFDDVDLSFIVKVLPEYPLKRMSSEAITFYNSDLLEYDHVMGDGSICIHTSHNIELRNKLIIDIASLKRWIQNYYTNKVLDVHYEHIIMHPSPHKEIFHSYIFTNVSHHFKRYDFGFFDCSRMLDGSIKGKKVANHVVLNFKDRNTKLLAECEWSTAYKNIPAQNKSFGLYIYTDEAPVQRRRFIINNWLDLQSLVSQDFFYFLYTFQKTYRKLIGTTVPLMIGYRISDVEIHWQSTMLEIGQFPITHEKTDKKWQGYFIDKKIDWAYTRNSSYHYFFGRGKFGETITNAKILIIGNGAIGSIVAKTLTKGGCKIIDIIDFDVKEPENVCRSEYSFTTGITDKTDELMEIMTSISPFVETRIMDNDFFYVHTKILNTTSHLKDLEKCLNEYDIIFDCSTDNDLMYILSKIKLNQLVTLSLTNNAKALVCGADLSHYEWTLNQFENILENDTQDIYNPTGCWSPTFKASYNDISVLVQHALKHINVTFNQKKKLRNFVVDTIDSDGFQTKLMEF